MSCTHHKLILPKQDWSVPSSEWTPITIKNEILDELKSQLPHFTINNTINPHHIKHCLRHINYHLDHTNIYKLIENMCLEYDVSKEGKTPEEFIDYITAYLACSRLREGVKNIFDSMKDVKQGEVTVESLTNIIKELGDDWTKEDVKEIWETIASPNSDTNIDIEEFYYIMTKKPGDALKIVKISNNK